MPKSKAGRIKFRTQHTRVLFTPALHLTAFSKHLMDIFCSSRTYLDKATLLVHGHFSNRPCGISGIETP